ncbi:VRR-NUC domain-containing protein [Candidatus Pacearchaeota archaeon]|nr:VRR-NUC domain-containing protein [Candidatus Pacearchaeota archaeon]
MKKKKKVSTVPCPTEHAEQCSIFRRAQLHSRQWPELRFLNGSLNGVRLTIGQAVKSKNTGMKKGYPDIFLPVRRGKHSGLFIELKRVKGGRIEPEQKLWATVLISQGYRHEFCKGGDAAWKVIIDYLNS